MWLKKGSIHGEFMCPALPLRAAARWDLSREDFTRRTCSDHRINVGECTEE